MGGVVLAGGGPGSDAANVAYRAVPAAPGAAAGITLPIGIVPLLADPPELDPDQPDFNFYELANLVYNPPWNLQLVTPEPPSSDITIAVGKNSLAVDLGEVRGVLPEDRSRLGGVSNGPAIGFGLRGLFVAAAPLVHYENDVSMNDALERALTHGEEFRTSTDYALFDQARGQVAAGLHLGWAGALHRRGDSRQRATGLYAGLRLKVLRGLAYGDADNLAAFTTRDTLFATDPVDIHYVGRIRDAGPEGGRLGRGVDLGAVWVFPGFEFGVGVNDLATRIDWRVRESVAFSDSATGEYRRQTVRDGAPFTSEVPAVATVNAATRLGPVVIAADVVRGLDLTLAHAGLETWLGRLALRCGANLDANRMLQGAGGAGLKLGRFGLDLAVASHSRNLSRERGVELAAGVALYSR